MLSLEGDWKGDQFLVEFPTKQVFIYSGCILGKFNVYQSYEKYILYLYAKWSSYEAQIILSSLMRHLFELSDGYGKILCHGDHTPHFLGYHV